MLFSHFFKWNWPLRDIERWSKRAINAIDTKPDLIMPNIVLSLIYLPFNNYLYYMQLDDPFCSNFLLIFFYWFLPVKVSRFMLATCSRKQLEVNLMKKGIIFTLHHSVIFRLLHQQTYLYSERYKAFSIEEIAGSIYFIK